MSDITVPKGLTLDDASQAQAGADTSPIKVPKGLALDGQQPQATPKFGPAQQAAARQAGPKWKG